MLLHSEFTEFSITQTESRAGLISQHSHRNIGLQRASASAKWPALHGPSLVPAAPQPELHQSLVPTPTLHPQQDSVKPWASCVISTSCTQGRECNAVFVHWRRPVSSPVLMSQPSRLGKPKNIQLCVCEQKNQGDFGVDETTAARSLFLSNSSPHWNNRYTLTSLCNRW